MLFDCTALVFSLVASVIVKWPANPTYTYGFGRVETLVGFINSLALVFASGNIVWEAIERLISPQELKTDNLMVVSILGFVVNMVGIFAFDHGGAHGHAGHNHGPGEHHAHHDSDLDLALNGFDNHQGHDHGHDHHNGHDHLNEHDHHHGHDHHHHQD